MSRAELGIRPCYQTAAGDGSFRSADAASGRAAACHGGYSCFVLSRRRAMPSDDADLDQSIVMTGVHASRGCPNRCRRLLIGEQIFHHEIHEDAQLGREMAARWP